MIILGINAYHGDAAAAVVKDGELIAAVEEERFNRIKHCAGFPTESVRYCLKVAGIEAEAIDHIGISRDPAAHLHRKVLFAARRAARGISDFGVRKGISNFGFRNSDLPAPQGNGDSVAPALLVSRDTQNSKFEIRNSKFPSELRNPKFALRQITD